MEQTDDKKAERMIEDIYKRNAKMSALEKAPTQEYTAEGNIAPLSADQIIQQAEIIYQWILKGIYERPNLIE